jgi:hypothetical protein
VKRWKSGLQCSLSPTENSTKAKLMSAENPTQILATGEATGFIPAPGNNGKPITVIGTAAIREAFDAKCIE